jgi:riboflavin kinase/FMN adenylyltransferase
MEILYGPNFNIDSETAVAIGKFDGIHLGHKKIIQTLSEVSRNMNLKNVVYTFDKNPKLVLNHEKFTPLMTNEEKSKALEKLNIDYLVYENFDNNFASLLPEEFVKDILVKKLNVKAVIIGENSTFGKDRSGTAKLMKELGKKYGFQVFVVELLKENGEVISSTKLREKRG